MEFLVDAQLPPLLCNWINETSIHHARHVSELQNGLESTDTRIWEIALKFNETIISKDFDFLDRALVSNNAPPVLHLKFGNCSNRQLIKYINQNWKRIVKIFKEKHTIISCSLKEIEYW